MKALLSRATGGPETLEIGELDKPEPKPGEVVVAVKACAINYPDVLMIVDKYQFKPERPFAPGGEVAGVIDAVGEGVEGFASASRMPRRCCSPTARRSMRCRIAASSRRARLCSCSARRAASACRRSR
ncbi:MAG: alcohol dehydrogenase catalytic domain-containing protein [Sphingomonadales bacterium]|nr:alcohol dehydrogenase catalytic domain-containing protein [Sphingomonadales bacterium]